jgi:hypothetical protein
VAKSPRGCGAAVRMMGTALDRAGESGLDCDMFRCAAFLLAAVALFGLAGAPKAQTFEFSTMANISATMGVVGGRVCLGEASRQDIGCPTYAPSVTTGGQFIATSMATGGLTVTGATSLSTISATIGDFTTLRVNGVPVTGGGGGSASPTNVPAFSVHRNGVNQTVTAAVNTGVDWTNEYFDTLNNFDTSTDRFTPNVAGRYLIQGSLYCGTVTSYCQIYINKNGGIVGTQFIYSTDSVVELTTIVEMNGTTDYLTMSGMAANGTTFNGSTAATYFQGSLLASGNGLISGTSGPLDRISSSNSQAMALATDGGTVSFTLGGTAGAAYLHPALGLVASGVSTTGSVSASRLFVSTVGGGAGLTIGGGGGSGGPLDRISTSGVSSGAGLAAVVADAGTVNFTLGGTAGAAYLHPALGLVVAGVSTTGSVSASRLFVSTVGGGAGLTIAGGGGTPAGVSGSIQFNGGGSFAGRNDLVVDSAGRVGIGNAAPNASLEVAGRVSTTVLQLGTDAGGCTTTTIGTVRRDPATGRTQICRM